jgi:cell division protein FtsQ
LARWNNAALVNRQGEVFVARSEQALPAFTGQDGTADEVTQHYTQFSQQLAALGLQVTQLALSPRHAWQLRLSNGMVLELGREDMQQRLATFVEVYPHSLAAMQSKVKYVDLRYRNGFAVGGLANGGLAKQG